MIGVFRAPVKIKQTNVGKEIAKFGVSMALKNAKFLASKPPPYEDWISPSQNTKASLKKPARRLEGLLSPPSFLK